MEASGTPPQQPVQPPEPPAAPPAAAAAQPQVYKHPDTGEEVEIPTGSNVVRNGDFIDTQLGKVLVEVEDVPKGEVLYWHNPPALKPGEHHKDYVEGYQARFARDSVHRRVLGSITDETDLTQLGARNTVPALAYFLARDTDTPQITPLSKTELQLRAPGQQVNTGSAPVAEDQVEAVLEQLVKAGLVVQRDDGSYQHTDAGVVELRN